MKYLSGFLGSNFFSALGIFFFIFVFADVFKPQQNQNNFADGQISGIFIDFKTREPLEFVNFILTSLKDSNLVTGTTSGKDGRFLLKGIADGSYKAKVSLMGYKTRTRSNMVLSPKQKTIQLDTIYMIQKEIFTDEVKIVSDKYPIVYDKENKDKLIISPDRSWGNNAYELLESAPLVDVDIMTDAINIFGQKETKIYIDGMPMRFSGISESKDLRTLPFWEIDKIEIVMNAVAEYGVISDGGIINIVTKKNKIDQFSGSAGLNVNNDNSLSTNSGIKSTFGKLTLSGHYSNSYSKHNSNTTSIKRFDYENTSSYINQEGSKNNKTNDNGFSISASYRADTTCNITVQSSYRDNLRNNDIILANNILDQYYSEVSRSISTSAVRSLHKFLTNSISVRKYFDKKGHFLNGTILFVKNQMTQNNDVNRQQVTSSSFTEFLHYQKNTSANTNNSLNWTLNYNIPISQTIKFAALYSGSLKKLAMNSNYTSYDTVTQRYLENDAMRTLDKYYDNTHDLSLSGTGTVKKIQYDLGVWINNTTSTIKTIVPGLDYIVRSYSFNPTIGVSTDISESGRIQLRYSQRTTYPLNKYLNPYVDYSDSTNIIVGNPALKPSINGLYSVSYRIMEGKFFGSINVSYSLRTNNILPVSRMINSTTTKTTFENLATRKSYGLSFFFDDKVFNWLEIEPYFSVYQTELISPSVNNKGREWNSSISIKSSFEDFVFQFSCRYSSPSYNAQEKSKAAFSADAAAKIFLFDKSLALTLKVNDLFNTSNSNSDTYGAGFSSINSTREKTRIFALDIFYFFNSQAKENIVEQNSDEVPDDF